MLWHIKKLGLAMLLLSQGMHGKFVRNQNKAKTKPIMPKSLTT